MMKLSLIVLAAVLLSNVSVKAQTEQANPTASPISSAQTTASPEVAEAARLNARVLELYKSGKFDEALPLAQQVLTLREKALAPTDRRIADALTNLAVIYADKKETGKAESLFQRALTIYENALGPASDAALVVVSRLMVLRFNKGDYDKAEALAQQLVAGNEKKLGANNIGVAVALTNLANIYAAKSELAKARQTFARVLDIIDQAAPPALPAGMYEPLANYLTLLYRQQQTDEVKAQIERTNKMLLTVGRAAGGNKGVQSVGVLNGRAVLKPQPEYPLAAKMAHAQGVVVVRIVVDETGKVIEAEATNNADPALKRVSVEAARRARFTPTLFEGVPVKVSGFITYNFVLQ